MKSNNLVTLQLKHKKSLFELRHFLDCIQRKLSTLPFEVVSIKAHSEEDSSRLETSITMAFRNSERAAHAKSILFEGPHFELPEEAKTIFQKKAKIEERLHLYAKRFDSLYLEGLLEAMNHFFFLAKERYLLNRSLSQIVKMIVSKGLFRQMLHKGTAASKKRNVLVKVFRISPRKTLLVIGLQFLREKEFFDENHLLKILEKEIPLVEFDPETLQVFRKGRELRKILSLEIEKKNSPFSPGEIQWLREDLVDEIRNHVEVLVPPLFMPRNEEEIMRNVLVLARELKYVRDIPQVAISFDHQSKSNLFFTIIWVRVAPVGALPLFDALKGTETLCRFLPDRIKSVGFLRKKHPKEAIIFRAKVRKEPFLRREGHAIDIHLARAFVTKELQRTFGSFRDFNGGMITKQQENYQQFQEKLVESKMKVRSSFLDPFFYSITPPVFQTLLDAESLCLLYELMKEAIRFQSRLGGTKILLNRGGKIIYLVAVSETREVVENFEKEVRETRLSSEVAKTQFTYHDHFCLGLILMITDPLKREEVYKNILSRIESVKIA